MSIAMKTRTILRSALLVMAWAPAQAQQVTVWFAAPTDVMVETFGTDAARAGFERGYRMAAVSARRFGEFEAVAPEALARVHRALTWESSDLAAQVRALVELNGICREVRIVLVDDHTGVPMRA